MRLLAGAVTAIALSAPVAALAADLPVKARPVPPPVVYNWTGFYLGGNAGYSWGRATTDQVDTFTSVTTLRAFSVATGAEVATIPGFPGTFPAVGAPAVTAGATSDRAAVNGFVGGGQIGYNWQWDKFWVLGLEADFQGSTERGSSTICVGACASGSAIALAEYRLRWFGTVRGRVGVLPTDTILLYVTGGFAYGQLNADYTSGILATGIPFAAGSASSTRAGWTVGGGVEGAIDRHWTWRVEYLYMDLGSVSTGLTAGSATIAGPSILVSDARFRISSFATGTNVAAVSTRFTDNIVRAAINYRF